MMSRWTGLAAAMLIQACGGLTYTYAVYSEHLKESLGYTQQQTDDVGAAKDFGYCVGIIGGILYNFYPPWVTIAIGAVLHFSGYFMVWLTVTKRVRPLFWLLCTSIGAGVGGDSWLDTACMMTSLQNFRESRGTVVGLLKAQIGISGAIFVTIYKAYFKPDVDEYILMVATVPAAVSLVLAYFVRPLPPGPEDRDQTVKRRFQTAYGGILVLAMFLLVTSTIQALLRVDKALIRFIAIFALFILGVTCYLVGANSSLCLCATSQRKVRDLPYTTSRALPPDDSEMEADSQEQFLSKHSSRPAPSEQGSQSSKSARPKLHMEGGSEDTLVTTSRTEEDTASLERLITGESAESFAVEHRTHPHGRPVSDNGMPRDLTLYESVQHLNYWLLAFVMMTGPGSGLAVINNLAQMGQALFSKQVVLFVGLISIWSCLGRLTAGYGSDALVRVGFPRPVCLFLAATSMAAGCLLLSLGHAPLLYFGSAVVGFCYGSFWALTPAVLSEVFGLTHFAAIYKTIVSFSPVGAFLLSAKLIGYLYDEEVERYHAQRGPGPKFGEHTCYGRACFESSLRLLALICGFGAAASMLLTIRTQRLYSRS